MSTETVRRYRWRVFSILTFVLSIMMSIAVGAVLLKVPRHDQLSAHQLRPDFEVLSGLDVLEQSNFKILQKKESD